MTNYKLNTNLILVTTEFIQKKKPLECLENRKKWQFDLKLLQHLKTDICSVHKWERNLKLYTEVMYLKQFVLIMFLKYTIHVHV